MGIKKDCQIKVESKNNVAIVLTDGPLTEIAAREWSAVVRQKIDENFTRFVFDFGHTRAISSPAVASILEMAEIIVEERKGKIVASGLTDLNLKVFEMVGLLTYLDPCINYQEALKKVLI